MKIITISREFGSGGRELGKRLADCLGWDYYDREIIDTISREKGFAPDYVQAALEGRAWRSVPITFSRSFTASAVPDTALLVKEMEVIERIAQAGRDCVIVGRNADYYLRAQNPFRIFVCANTDAKLRRCRERAPEGEALTDREIMRQIRRIDRGRTSVRELVGGERWGDRTVYHLTVNTSDWDFRDLAPAVAAFAQQFFERSDPDR